MMLRKKCVPVRCVMTFSGAWLLFLVGCSNSTKPNAESQANTPAAIGVEVATAHAEQIVDFREFTGRTVAVNSVDVRPRVSGYLLQTPRSDAEATTNPPDTLLDGSPYHDVVDSPQYRLDPSPTTSPDSTQRELFVVRVKEGDEVRMGEPLFEIDPLPYRLAYQQAASNLEATQARLLRFRRQLERLEQLVANKAASSSELDEAQANTAEATAQIENLRAIADRAYLDWQYTQVRSPISGIVGRSPLSRGNLAVADTTILTTVVSSDPIYVSFNVDENSALDYGARVQQGSVKSARDSKIPVEMSLANESGFPHRGVVDFVDNTTDPETGNTLVRARFENPSGAIVPGRFARIRAPFTATYEAVLIPTIALGSDQQGRYVMVVDENFVVRRQAVVEGTIQGDESVIGEGLKVGDRVIVSGLQRVRPGALVRIENRSEDEHPLNAHDEASSHATGDLLSDESRLGNAQIEDGATR